jgi:hypothetical protein
MEAFVLIAGMLLGARLVLRRRDAQAEARP